MCKGKQRAMTGRAPKDRQAAIIDQLTVNAKACCSRRALPPFRVYTTARRFTTVSPVLTSARAQSLAPRVNPMELLAMLPLENGQALIVEDNPDTREWLISCVQSAFPGLTISVAGDLSGGSAQLESRDFDLALIDLGLPDGSGLELIRALTQQRTPCYIVVATIYDDDRNLFTALKAGAKGYILKDQDRERIVSYLKGIKKNRPPLSPASSQRLIEHFNNQGVALEKSQLTRREIDVICMIGKGYSVEDAALALALSPDTIKGYVKSIYSKLEVSNRSEVTLEAIRLGIIEAH